MKDELTFEYKLTKEDVERVGLTRYDVLKIILIDADYKVFKIYADYKASKPHPYYYMIGKTKSYIKKYFEERYTWLKVYSIEEVDYKSMSEEERDSLASSIII